MTLSISAIIQQLIQLAKTDAKKLVLPLLANFLTSVGNNPSEPNLIVQLAVLEAGLLAALPQIEQDEVKELAQLMIAEAQTLNAPAKA